MLGNEGKLINQHALKPGNSCRDAPREMIDDCKRMAFHNVCVKSGAMRAELALSGILALSGMHLHECRYCCNNQLCAHAHCNIAELGNQNLIGADAAHLGRVKV